MDATVGPPQLKRLFDAVVALGGELDLTAALQRVVTVAAELVSARYAALGVLDDAGDGLAQFVTTGITDDERAAIAHEPKGLGILGHLIHTPSPVRIADLSQHPESVGFPEGHPPMTSFLGVPILVRGQAFGNLYLCDKLEGGEFSPMDEELVVALSAAAGAAIETARLHARVSELALYEDRDRIARDLHDTVIQRLFAIGLGLQGLVPVVGDPVIAQRLDNAIDQLDETVREVRSAIFELHAPQLPGNSLRRAVLDIAAESVRPLGFEPQVRFEGPVDTAVEVRTAEHVVAVVREALANVARHAGATDVWVAVTVDQGHLLVEISDDGVGPPEGNSPGRGLRNMAERARLLGGRCTLEPRQGELRGDCGSVLRWMVPAR